MTEERDETIRVKTEPRTYSEHGEHSYFSDLVLNSRGAGDPFYRSAHDRLVRHAHEADVEGETRASTTSNESFAVPQYLTEYWAAFRSPDRNFADQCHAVPLPPVGMQVNIPTFSGLTTVSTPVETGGTPDTDPSGVNVPGTVVTQTGQIVLSQQLFDRGGYSGDGGAFDKIATTQINQQLNAAIDTYAINVAIANASAVTDNAALSITNLFTDLSAAREKLTDTVGTRLSATHLFTTADLSGWITKQVDSQARPIFLPDAGAIMSSKDDDKYKGFLGIALPGGLLWFQDDNIPAVGSNTQLLVANPSQVYLFEGDSIGFSYPETYAENLSVVIGLRKYVAVVPRYAKAVTQITGNAFPTTLV